MVTTRSSTTNPPNTTSQPPTEPPTTAAPPPITDPPPPMNPPPDIVHDLTAAIQALSTRVSAMTAPQPPVATVCHPETSTRGAARGRAPPYDRGRLRWYDDQEEDEDNHGFQVQRRPRAKIDFPKYQGGDPRGWVLKAEKYFRYFDIPEEMKVEVAAMHLEGDALDLYAWINGEDEILHWAVLVKIFQENYGPPEFQNPDEYLCAIKQTGSVTEYRQEFIRRVAHVRDWPDHCLLGVFLTGLKDELKTEVRIHKPRTVFKASSLALEFEAKVGLTRGSYFSGHSRQNFSPSTTNQYQLPRPTLSSPENLNNSTPQTLKPGNSQSHLKPWENERQQRREKGLCYRCGDKFAPGHRCKSTFSNMECSGDNNDWVVDEAPCPDIATEDTSMAEISFHQISSQSSTSTMKLQGTLQDRKILILVDSGSTHNFISSQLVKELKLPTQAVPGFGVTIGNGEIIACDQICPNLVLQLPDLVIQQDFYPFSINGAEVVLGIKWLATLDTVQVNWKDMSLVFQRNGKQFRLQGLKPTTGISTSSSFQLLSTDHQLYYPPAVLTPILQQYESVFEEPKQLPPPRSQTHAIHLLPNSKPPNLRPYRYPYHQKTEIEQQRRLHGQISSVSSVPLPISDSFELIVQPESVVSHRWKHLEHSGLLELLIHWKNRPPEEDSWEDYDLLQQQFPEFRLEDKSTFKRGCNDRTPVKEKPWLTYARRK